MIFCAFGIKMKPNLTDSKISSSKEVNHIKVSSPSQSEMPFAVVDGEPITSLPQDLYIPPQALQVFLEAFEGPLDLLLYLIRRQNLDILDIPIAEIFVPVCDLSAVVAISLYVKLLLIE